MLTRIFNWLVGDAGVDGVDPALHRRALWMAFTITGAVYLVACALAVPSFWYHQMPGDPLFWVTFELQMLGPPPWYYIFLTFALLYALVLRVNGATLPLAFLDLTAVFVLAWVVRCALPFLYFVDSLLILLVMWLLLARQHVDRKLPVALFWLAAAVLFASHLMMVISSAASYSTGFGSGISYRAASLAYNLLGSVGMLPFAVMLPVAVFARPRTQERGPATGSKWTPLLWLAVALAAAYAISFGARAWLLNVPGMLSPGILAPEIVGGLGWSLTLAGLVLGWWYLRRATGAHRFAAFMLMAVVGVRAWEALPVLPPQMRRLDLIEPLALLIGVALALYLCSSAAVRPRWIPAVLTLTAGLFIGWLWLRSFVHLPGVSSWLDMIYRYQVAGDPTAMAAQWVALEFVVVSVWLAALILAYHAAFGPGAGNPRSEASHV